MIVNSIEHEGYTIKITWDKWQSFYNWEVWKDGELLADDSKQGGYEMEREAVAWAKNYIKYRDDEENE